MIKIIAPVAFVFAIVVGTDGVAEAQNPARKAQIEKELKALNKQADALGKRILTVQLTIRKNQLTGKSLPPRSYATLNELGEDLADIYGRIQALERELRGLNGAAPKRPLPKKKKK